LKTTSVMQTLSGLSGRLSQRESDLTLPPGRSIEARGAYDSFCRSPYGPRTSRPLAAHGVTQPGLNILAFSTRTASADLFSSGLVLHPGVDGLEWHAPKYSKAVVNHTPITSFEYSGTCHPTSLRTRRPRSEGRTSELDGKTVRIACRHFANGTQVASFRLN